MAFREILRLPDGRLRTIWRLAGFFIVATVAFAIQLPILSVAAAFANVDGMQAGLLPVLIFSIAAVIALVAAHVVMVRVVERLPWEEVWLGRGSFSPRTLGSAAMLGAAAIAIPAVALMGIGWLDAVAAPGSSTDAIRYGIVMLAVLIPAAAWEELLFRGYPMRVLVDAIGGWAAVIVTGAAFGALHAANLAEVQPLALAIVMLAGIFLGWIVLARRSLAAGIAAHVAWNAVLVAVLHTEVSGAQLAPPPAYRVVDDGPDWATGGPWGAEGGVAAGVGLTAALLLTLTRRKRLEER